jgi:hypothetical protein
MNSVNKKNLIGLDCIIKFKGAIGHEKVSNYYRCCFIWSSENANIVAILDSNVLNICSGIGWKCWYFFENLKVWDENRSNCDVIHLSELENGCFLFHCDIHYFDVSDNQLSYIFECNTSWRSGYVNERNVYKRLIRTRVNIILGHWVTNLKISDFAWIAKFYIPIK